MRIFMAILGLLLLNKHNEVLQKSVKWFLASIDNISSLFIVLKDLYLYVSDKFRLLGISNIVCYIITAVLSLFLIMILIFVSIK